VYNPYPDNWNTPPPPTPANPYAQQSGYDPASPYGRTNPYPGQQPPGTPGMPRNPHAGPANNKPTFGFNGYAGWLTRVGASLIDGLLGSLAGLPLWIGYGTLLSDATTRTDARGVKHLEFHSSGTVIALIWLGIVTSLAFNIWNVYIRQGRTGATIGKSVLAIRLVNSDIQPIGVGRAFLRQILHVVDSLPCGIGYLWPIWDSHKQTFADKIMSTYVIHASIPQPRVY
jgi:uncharacterized RDD family membrane protein YckC